jgi:DNA repair photolyase
VTDCYQPLEASWQLTRGCLRVCLEYRNPVGVITKSPLIERDAALLAELNQVARVQAIVSIPLWKLEIAQALEPRVATPQRRIRTIERLAHAGVPVGVNVAPLIPGLEEDMVRILERAREAGATRAGYVLLRLPGPVKGVFESRLRSALPLQAEKVLNRIRETRGGARYDSRFGVRGRGEGAYAQAMNALFTSHCRRLGFDQEHPGPDPVVTFRRPPRPGAQLPLL